jgi:hypothetical protein
VRNGLKRMGFLGMDLMMSPGLLDGKNGGARGGNSEVHLVVLFYFIFIFAAPPESTRCICLFFNRLPQETLTKHLNVDVYPQYNARWTVRWL